MKKEHSQRLLDLVLLSCTIPLLLPLMGGIAFLIAVKKDGPVFFCQSRIGFLKKPFKIFKFRTMVDRRPEEIDQLGESVLTKGVDSRVTPVGRILRATSLDELPQLFNVLNGTMSLVGPRPVIPEQLLAIPREYENRFNVRPGITGWAQVNGRRSIGWLQQLRLDSWYASNRTLVLDVWILLKTIWVVLRGSGTYGTKTDNWRSFLPKSPSE